MHLRLAQWKNRVNDEGQRYITCARCGKEDEAGPVAPPSSRALVDEPLKWSTRRPTRSGVCADCCLSAHKCRSECTPFGAGECPVSGVLLSPPQPLDPPESEFG